MFMNYKDNLNPNSMIIKAFMLQFLFILIGGFVSFGFLELWHSEYLQIGSLYWIIIGVITFLVVAIYICLILYSVIMYWVSVWRALTYKCRSHWWYVSMLIAPIIGLFCVCLLKNKSTLLNQEVQHNEC